MDMSAEHEAGIIIEIKITSFKMLFPFRVCLLVEIWLHIKCIFFLYLLVVVSLASL